MKKIIFILFSSAFILDFAVAQISSDNHLSFKGIPIEGTLDQYVAKMKNAGFEYLEERNGCALLKGQFAGFDDCIMRISELELVNIVGTVDVIFPSCSDLYSLTEDYTHLKSMLIEKYGEPIEVKEEKILFKRSTSNMNSFDELYRIKNMQTWYAKFQTEKGEIQLSVQNGEEQTYVVLRYSDRINSEIARSAAMRDL